MHVACLGVVLLSVLFLPAIRLQTTFVKTRLNQIVGLQADDSQNIWYHDGSLTDGFVRNSSWPIDRFIGNNEWTITDGDLGSTGDLLYFTGIPSASYPVRHHGPVFTHEFEQSFELSQLRNFTVRLEIDNSQASYAGKFYVMLVDSEYRPVLTSYVADVWDILSYGYIYAQYTKIDGTFSRHGLTDSDDFTNFNGVMHFNYDLQTGVEVYVNQYGSKMLHNPNVDEFRREITHVVLMSGRLERYDYMPCMIDDIYVGWDSEPAPDSVDFGLILFGIGIAVELVIIVGIIRKRRQRLT
jgi:hypothetical protein